VMAAEGSVNAVASQDHDSIIFGAPVLVRNVTISGKRRLPSKGIVINVQPERITLSSVMSATGLTRVQLVDFAILLGTDFNPDGFEGVGPVRALKYLKRYGSLEKVTELKEEVSKVNYLAIRDLYLHPPATAGIKPEWKQPDPQALLGYLVDEHSFSRERVQAALARVAVTNKPKSETLEKWFG
jgi:flap endonuclease-1